MNTYSVDPNLVIPYQIPLIEDLSSYFYDQEFVSIFPSEPIFQLIQIPRNSKFENDNHKQIIIEQYGSESIRTKKLRLILH